MDPSTGHDANDTNDGGKYQGSRGKPNFLSRLFFLSVELESSPDVYNSILTFAAGLIRCCGWGSSELSHKMTCMLTHPKQIPRNC